MRRQRRRVGHKLGVGERTVGAETCVRPTTMLHATMIPLSAAELLRIHELRASFNVRTCSWFRRTIQVKTINCKRSSDEVHVRSILLGGFPTYRTSDRSEPDSRDYSDPLDMCLHAGGWRNGRRSVFWTFSFGRYICVVRAVTHFTRLLSAICKERSVLAFQRPKRSDRNHQAASICMLGNHGLDG